MRFIPNFNFLYEQTSHWVHKSIAPSDPGFRKHKIFLTNAVLIALAIAITLPVAALSLKPMLPVLVAGIFALTVALTSALWTSKTGKLEHAKLVLQLLLSAAVVGVVATTGEFTSPYLAFICVLPFLFSFEKKRLQISFAAGLAMVVGLTAHFTTELQALAHSVFTTGAIHPNHTLIASVMLLIIAFVVSVKLNKNRSLVQRETAALRNQSKLLSKNNIGLIATHDKNGGTLFVSENCRAITGTSAASLCNSGYLEKIHLQDRVVFLKALSDAAHTGNDQLCEIRMRYKGQGQQIWKALEVICRAERSSINGRVEVVSIASDVSERNSLRSKLAAVEEEVAKSAIAQRKFLGTISHEMRTPLNAIIGFSDIMHKELFGQLESKKHREYVGLIQNSGHHLLHVVNDMFDMTRIESGKYELNIQTFKMVEIADATLDMLTPIAKKNGAQIICDVPANLPEMQADKHACQQIMINLVANAIKFSPDDGRVKITARQHGRSVRLQIKDNGIGIPSSFMPLLGKPFEQADKDLNRSFEGSGLGVSVVKGLVDLHGGNIEFSSEEGKGTTVTLTLPIRSKAARPVPANSENGLVHISAASPVKKQTITQTTVDHIGESRARVSA